MEESVFEDIGGDNYDNGGDKFMRRMEEMMIFPTNEKNLIIYM